MVTGGLRATGFWLSLLLVMGLWGCGNEPSPGPRTPPSQDLREAVGADGILEHARRLQEIADQHGGNRAAGTPGYDASADYVANTLKQAGYKVTRQSFEFPADAAVRRAELDFAGAQEAGFALMEGSGSGAARARIGPVDTRGSTSGCETEDFEGFEEGEVALLRRGTCSFGEKAANAEAAGARAALIFNSGVEEDVVLRGSLGGSRIRIPVMGTSEGLGEELTGRSTMPVATVSAAETNNNETTNVIAQTPGGDPSRTVMLGAHLDSVPQGPGINDNGSGVATVLEIAEEMAGLGIEPRNKVRFAFWGAEEVGLVGSRHYVEGLGREQVEEISTYLNFDMVGSPNFVRAVYEGPDEVENVLASYFEARNLEMEVNSALDDRSDHGPFQDAGVPTGGLFSGAGGSKTGAQARAFGGEAGKPYDSCYHRACDDIDNLTTEALDTLSDGAAHATAVLAQSQDGP